jgi:hypothetical protein
LIIFSQNAGVHYSKVGPKTIVISYPAFAQLANKEKYINVLVRQFGLVLEKLKGSYVFALELTPSHNAATSREEVNKKQCKYQNTL